MSDPRAVEALGALLPFLDGKREREEILSTLDSRGTPRSIVEQILQHLEKTALIEEADTAGLSTEDLNRFRDQITFFSRFTTSGGSRFQAALRQGRVAVCGAGRLGRGMCEQLIEAGFGEVVVLADEPPDDGWVSELTERAATAGSRLEIRQLDRQAVWGASDGDRQPDLLLMAQENHDPQLLEAADGWSKRHDLPWLLVRAIDAREGWVGPLFLPGETASYLSLDARLQGNLPFYEEHQAFDQRLWESGRSPAPLGGLPAFFDLLGSMAVVEAIKLISEIDVPKLAGRFLTLNLWNWEMEVHDVWKVPGIDPFAESRPTAFPWKESDDAEDRTATS